MRWESFGNFSALNLQLGPCLDWHVGPAILRGGGTHPEFTRKSWVERQVEYIAVRPFASLNMDAQDDEGDNQRTIYVVWFQIKGEERQCARLRYLYDDGPGTTIQQLIDGLMVWHAEYWTLQPGRPLAINAIVRHIMTADSRTKYYRESLEFFLVPNHAQPFI